MTSRWLAPIAHNIPKDLIYEECGLPLCQWVCWKVEDRDGKPTKVPYQSRHPQWRASSTRPDTWASLAQALHAYKNANMLGVGIVVPPGFVGLDLDRCVVDGVLEPWAAYLVDAFDSYAELSPSGKGVRIWVRGSMPGPRCRTNRLEMYDCHSPRYLTVTGHLLRSRPIIEKQNVLGQLYKVAFGHEAAEGKNTTPVSHDRHEVEEADVWLVVDKLLASRHADRFAALFLRGDLAEHSHDHSRADLALCGLLAPYCDYDVDLIDAVFCKSALYRPKWDRPDYKTATLQKATDGNEPFWSVAQQAHEIINKESSYVQSK